DDTDPQGYIYSSKVSKPLLSKNSVYFLDIECDLYSVDIKTGRKKWKFKTESLEGMGAESRVPLPNAIISKEVIYFSHKKRNLYAVDGETGKQLWQFKSETVSPPVAANNLIYFSDGDGNLYAFRAGK
ncbi:hypothetical protein LCGC14_2442080, partial [marine sediment metagenome]